jgi:hypothetical protein
MRIVQEELALMYWTLAMDTLLLSLFPFRKPLSYCFIFIYIRNATQKSGIFGIAQIYHAVGFHAGNKNDYGWEYAPLGPL